MGKSYYDYNTNSWTTTKIEKERKREEKKRKNKRNKNDNNMGGGFLVMLTLMFVVIGAVLLTFTEKGQTILSMFSKQDTGIKYEDWEYSTNEDTITNGFDMGNAQQELADTKGYKVPMAEDNTKQSVSISNTINSNGFDLENTIQTHNVGNETNNSIVSIGGNANSQPSTQIIGNNNTITQTVVNNPTPIVTQEPIVTNTTPIPTETKPKYEYNEQLKAKAPNQVSMFESTINNMLIEINKVREEAGVSTVSLDQTLCEMSAYRSLDMIERNYYSHNYEDISQLKVVMSAWGRTNRHYENLAKVKSDDVVEACIKGWKNSSGHYSAMTNSDMTVVGIGIARYGEYYYVTTIYSN